MYFLSRRESKIEPRVSISLFTELTIVPRRNEQWISRNKTIRYHADSSVHTNGVIRQIFLPHLLHFNRSLDFFFPAILSLQNCCTTALQKGRKKKNSHIELPFMQRPFTERIRSTVKTGYLVNFLLCAFIFLRSNFHDWRFKQECLM